MRDEIKIGHVTLRVTKTFTNQYECAAWYQDVECHPQTVDLWFHPGYDRASYECVTFRFRGTVTSSDFRARWCGSLIGKSEMSRDAGQIADAGRQYDAHHLLNLMLGDQDYAIQLLDGVKLEAQPIQYGRGYEIDGRRHEPFVYQDKEGRISGGPHTGFLCYLDVSALKARAA